MCVCGEGGGGGRRGGGCIPSSTTPSKTTSETYSDIKLLFSIDHNFPICRKIYIYWINRKIYVCVNWKYYGNMDSTHLTTLKSFRKIQFFFFPSEVKLLIDITWVKKLFNTLLYTPFFLCHFATVLNTPSHFKY